MAPQKKDDLVLALDEAQRLQNQLNDKIALLKTLDRDQKNKISQLKDVARFYRAQRDRVDAYLSAMIDAAELKERPDEYSKRASFPDDPHTVGSVDTTQPPAPPYGRRPRIQEPRDDRSYEDGRAFALYRDKEPEKDWENF